MRYVRQLAWLMAAGSTAFPITVLAQQAPGQNNNAGVVQPPANVDPGIQVKPPVPSSKLPTTVIPPPGTPGGDPSTQAK